jgi:hypothetical protein
MYIFMFILFYYLEVQFTLILFVCVVYSGVYCGLFGGLDTWRRVSRLLSGAGLRSLS